MRTGCARHLCCCDDRRYQRQCKVLTSMANDADATDLNDKIWHALGRQADANRATALAILARTQRSVCKCGNTNDVVPDQLESWYVAQDEAVGVASTADVDARCTSQESTRCALGTKRVVPSVLELLKASCKTRAPVPRGATVNALAEQVAVECTV